MQSKHRALRGFKEWKKTIRKILDSYTHYNDDPAFLNRERSSEDTAQTQTMAPHTVASKEASSAQQREDGGGKDS